MWEDFLEGMPPFFQRRKSSLLYGPGSRGHWRQKAQLFSLEDTAPLRRLLAEAMAERVKAGTFGKPVLPKKG
jgi:hypothetical protein